jgi:hypothetical protein
MRSLAWCTGILGTVLISQPAFAQLVGPVSGAPAPLIGIGLPVAGLVVGAVWLVRRVKS